MRAVALVTGATRGIGKACALSLARKGFDVVVTGRTLREGEGRTTLPFARKQGEVVVPGSLETTAREIEALGRAVLPLPMDVLDRVSIDRMVAQTLERWGRIDLLVNNALYQGPGLMYPFLGFEIEQMEKSVLGNLVNQAHLTRLVLPGMIERGSGCVVGLSSHAAVNPPPAPPERGGWGFVYGAPKSGFHRIAEFVHVEHGKDGVLAFNVEPGFTVTESTQAMFGQDVAEKSRNPVTWPETTGEVVAWLATAPEARPLAGTLISAPGFFERRRAGHRSG